MTPNSTQCIRRTTARKRRLGLKRGRGEQPGVEDEDDGEGDYDSGNRNWNHLVPSHSIIRTPSGVPTT